MSVLFKALERASKARETLRAEPAPAPRLPLMGGRAPRRRRPPLLLSAVVAGFAVMLGLFLLFGGEMLSGLDRVAVDPPKVPGAPRKLPALAQQPAAEAPPAVTPAPAAPAAMTGATAPAPAAATVPVQVDAAVASPQAAGKPPPAAAAPVQPVEPPGPQVDQAAPTVDQASPPVSAVAAAPSPAERTAPPAGPAKPSVQPKTVQADEDLPAVLDRIRRQGVAPALAQSVSVNRRTASADLTGRDGSSAISVSVAAAHEDVNTAYDMLMHGQYESALGLYDKVLRTSPRNVAALLGKGTAEHKLRRFGDARESYRRVLALDPANREALTNMTAIVAEQAPDQALAELRTLQRNYPSFSPISAQIASIEAGRDNLSGAVVAMGDAVAQSPDNGLYRLNLAILEDRAGDRDAAVASYRQAIDMLGGVSMLPMPLDQIRQRLRYLQGR